MTTETAERLVKTPEEEFLEATKISRGILQVLDIQTTIGYEHRVLPVESEVKLRELLDRRGEELAEVFNLAEEMERGEVRGTVNMHIYADMAEGHKRLLLDALPVGPSVEDIVYLQSLQPGREA